jgi:hypothetical protein
MELARQGPTNKVRGLGASISGTTISAVRVNATRSYRRATNVGSLNIGCDT